jgi:hypothetical protein
MTLILTVANPRALYQSSDYQLTDRETGAPVSDRAGSKQLEARFKSLEVQLAFTGVAVVGSGSSKQRTIDWLAFELKSLPGDTTLQDICDSLSRRATSAMKPYGPRGVLTLVLAVAEAGEPFRVATISNAGWGARPPRARNHFDIAIHRISKPFDLITGFRDAVSRLEEHRLRALARAANRPATEVLDELAAINAAAARNSQGYVSEECWVTSQIADGATRRSAMRNVGERGGLIPLLMHGMDTSRWVKENFRAAPGKELRLVQRAGVMGRGVPLPPPEGDPRTFKLCGASVRGLLRSTSGHHCASIEIDQLDCIVVARRNEAVTVPFAEVRLSDVHPKCMDFPRPLFPWPTLSSALTLDGATVLRGWEYSVGYWSEAGMHRVEIPQSSRSIRSLAFLGEDDEIVIAVPISGITFAWESSHDAPAATTLQANVQWRTRPDGTRG